MIMLMYKTNRQVLRFGSTIVVWVNVVRGIRVFRSKGKHVVSRLASLSYNITGSINLSLPIPHIWASYNVMQSILHFSTLPTLIPFNLHIWHRRNVPMPTHQIYAQHHLMQNIPYRASSNFLSIVFTPITCYLVICFLTVFRQAKCLSFLCTYPKHPLLSFPLYLSISHSNSFIPFMQFLIHLYSFIHIALLE